MTTYSKDGEAVMRANVPSWPDACACGHSGYLHHFVFHGTHFGPDYFCKGNDSTCRCDSYRPAVRA